MTHIIGKPPAPKEGAVYSAIEAPMGRPSLPWRVRTPGGNLLPGYAQRHQAQKCADLLNEVSSRESDPAVTTYGELEPGCFFEWLKKQPYGEGGLCLCTDDGYIDPKGVHWIFIEDGDEEEWDPGAPVRRVPTSVVVHEEPGAAVSVGQEPGEYGLCIPQNRIVDRALLQRIVQQGAALLAQQDAKPEADPLVQRLAKNPEALERFNEAKAEPAEDRSKPAPFAGDDGLTPLPWAQGFLLSLAADLERLDERRADTLRRLAQSLRDQHDAQQAAKERDNG